jgi:uncharacterized membrane protein YdjX (TVP38/TMEM64 family)
MFLKELFKPAMLLCLILLIPVIPFLLLEEQVKSWIESMTGEHTSDVTVGIILFLLLTTDIFLPVPSSVVNTLAGTRLGILWGTAICWFGMNVGAIIGFWLARKYGSQLVARFTKQDDAERTARIIQQFGPFALILVRGVPLLAEASVLLVGMHKLSWRKFLPPVMLANLGLAFVYAAAGKIASDWGVNFLSLAIAIVLPVVLLLLFRYCFDTSPERQLNPPSNTPDTPGSSASETDRQT